MARLTQQQVEQWIAQNGGSGRVQYGVEQKQIKNPDPGSPEPYINIEVEVWRAYGADGKPTGAELTVRRGEDGDFEQIENVGTKPVTSSTDQDWHTEGTPDGQGGYDNSRPIMVRTVNGQRQERQLTGDELKDWNEAQQRSRNPGGKSDAEIKADEDKAAATARQARIDEQNAATRAAEARRAEAAEGRAAAQANRIPNPDVPGGFLERGPDGTWRPIKTEGVTTGALPEGAPRPSGILGDAAKDLEAFDAWLEPQVRAGKITAADADKKREARRKYWQTAYEEQQGIVNAQSTAQGQAITQRGQTLSDIGNRRSSATSIANQASSDFMPLADKLGSAPGGGAALMNAIREARFNAQDFVTMAGGNRNVDEIQPGPALRTVNAMPLPGGPTMGPGFNPRPNAIGGGAVGNQAAPSAVGPVSAGVTATTAAAANPTGPNVQAATDATMAGSNAAFAGAGVPPAAAPAPSPERQITLRHRGTGLESKVSESMLQDMTNRDEFEEVPATADRQSMMMTQSQPQPAPHFLAGSSRGHVYDPTPSIRAMIADPRYDNETIRQVVNEDYPGYPIDDLLRGAA